MAGVALLAADAALVRYHEGDFSALVWRCLDPYFAAKLFGKLLVDAKPESDALGGDDAASVLVALHKSKELEELLNYFRSHADACVLNHCENEAASFAGACGLAHGRYCNYRILVLVCDIPSFRELEVLVSLRSGLGSLACLMLEPALR